MVLKNKWLGRIPSEEVLESIRENKSLGKEIRWYGKPLYIKGGLWGSERK